MKIKIKNLGIIKQAELSLGDLTILCGGNNTGKTYVTYALFGFLSTWKHFFSIPIDDDKIRQLFAEAVIRIDLQECVKDINTIVAQGCQKYTRQLPTIFTSSAARFKDTNFQVIVDVSKLTLTPPFKQMALLVCVC